MTVSFAPDGTRVSKYASNLYQAFGGFLSAGLMEAYILSAFQRWAREANLNVGVVPDGGQAFGTNGPAQGDTRFGDIRVGAIPLDPSVFAITVRNDSLVSGTWGGEILFNSNAPFTNINQFYSVALHEAGHALGLKHSGLSGAVMNPAQLNGTLAVQDIAAVRGLYGVRFLDRNESANDPNDTVEDASRIENPGSLDGRIPLVVFGDLPVSGDVDWFELHPLSGYGGPISFEFVSAGISLLRGRLTVVDEAGNLVATQALTGSRGGRLKITVPFAADGTSYFARIEAVDGSLYSTGSFALVTTLDDQVNFSPGYISQVARGDYANLKQSDVREVFINHPQFFFNQELALNDTFLTADRLKATQGFGAGRHYQVHGSFSYLNDADFMALRTPDTLPTGNVMTLRLDTMEQGRLVPRMQAFDENQQPLSSNVLVNSNGQLVLQITGVQANQDYYVKATAEFPGDRFDLGNYTLTARFDRPAVSLATIGSGNVGPGQLRRYHALYVAEPQLFRFSLFASNGMDRSLGQVWMTVLDTLGRVVYRALTVPGETRTAPNIILRPGSYSVMVSFAGATNAPPTGLDYVIKGDNVTDPTGPEILPPGEKPFGKELGETNYTYPGGVSSPDPFLFVNGNLVNTGGTAAAPPKVDANAWYWTQAWLQPTVPPNI